LGIERLQDCKILRLDPRRLCQSGLKIVTLQD
jgi:hypothetical protein